MNNKKQFNTKFVFCIELIQILAEKNVCYFIEVFNLFKLVEFIQDPSLKISLALRELRNSIFLLVVPLKIFRHFRVSTMIDMKLENSFLYS